MSSKHSKNLFALILMASSINFIDKAQAQFTGGGYTSYNAGTGYYGAMQGCNEQWSRGTQSVSMSDAEKEERQKIAELQKRYQMLDLDRKKAELAMKQNSMTLKKFFDDEVYDFIVDSHIESGNMCTDYKTYPDCAVPKTGTDSKTATDATGKPLAMVVPDGNRCSRDVPTKLKSKWTNADPSQISYCAALSSQDAGQVSPSICDDKTLRPEDAPKYRTLNSAECKKAIAQYRKNKLLLDKAQSRMEDAKGEIEDRTREIANERERQALERKYRLENQMEAQCPDGTCADSGRGYSYQSQNSNLGSSLGMIGLGLGLGYLGKRYDDSRAEYYAQLGYPPQQGYPTAISLGFPFVYAGLYGALNGGSGRGGFSCAGSMNGGGYPWGANGGLNGSMGGPFGPYGPYANMGGALGYPNNMFGSPWGGGAYMPGFNPWGGFNGPNGGWPFGLNGNFAVNGMMNGPMFGNPMYGSPMSGGQMTGGQMYGNPMYGNPMGGAVNLGIPMSGFPMTGGQMYGNPMFGNPMYGGPMTGGQMYGNPMYGNPMYGNQMNSMVNNPQYQMQMLQMQQQMIQQQMQQQQMYAQMQQQYYQAQVQAQMQQQQRQAMIAQQAMQVQQEIASLQMRLQMLYSGAYTGSGSLGGGYYGSGGLYGGGSTGIGVSIGVAAPSPNLNGGGYTTGYGNLGGYNNNGGYIQPPPPPPGTTTGYPNYPTYPTGGQVTIPTNNGNGR